MSNSIYKNDLSKIKEQLECLLYKAGFEVFADVSIGCQYDDADDAEYFCTNKDVPAFQNPAECACVYKIGAQRIPHTRVTNDVCEYVMTYKMEYLSYSFIIIHVNLSEFKKHYGADFKPEETDWCASTKKLCTTFLDYLVISFLESYCDSHLISMDNSIRSAGDKYVYSLLCGNTQATNLNIHNDLNVLSSLQYEKQSNSGRIIIIPNKATEYLDVSLEQAVPLYHYKKARKLFEISDDNVFLIGDSRAIYGIATRETLGQCACNTLLQVQIHGPLNWEILRYDPTTNNCKSLIHCNNSHYKIKPENYQIDEFRAIVIKRYPTADIEELLSIVNAAVNQKHGTTIVFSPQAMAEAERLKESCFRIKPARITQMTHQISSIDGAVLCDMAGVCHAIGIILDGSSSESEDISRGARHNSAKRYKASHPECVICVISEDGDMTIE